MNKPRLALAAALLALAPCLAAAQDLGTLGDAKVSAEQVRQLLALDPALRQRVAADDRALRALVEQELLRRALLEEARSQGWDRKPEVVLRAERARDDVVLAAYVASYSGVPAGYPDDAAVKAYYKANRARLIMPPLLHLAQIFVKRPNSKRKAEAAAKRAADLAALAQQSGTDFGDLARAKSEDPASKDKGGDLGWLAETSILPAVRPAVMRLKPGDVTGAIEGGGGWHVVKLIESKPAAPATLEQARPAIVRELRALKVAEERKAHIAAIIKKDPPQLDDQALKALRSELK